MKYLSNLLKSESVRFDQSQVLYQEILGCETPRRCGEKEKAAAEAKAARIVAGARKEAEVLLKKAEAEKLELFSLSQKEGYKKGFDEGQKQAVFQVQSQNQAVLDEIEALVEKIDAAKTRIWKKTKRKCWNFPLASPKRY